MYMATLKTRKVKQIAKKNTAVKSKRAGKPSELTAAAFIKRLKALQSDDELKKIQRYFKSGEGQYGADDKFMGVKMGQLFALAIEFNGMPVKEIEKLLESPVHEVRAGAVSIMDKESRTKKITESRLKEFFELYIKRHDRINNWDLVDLGCLYMTGRYLFDKSRIILYKLARSTNMWERRTAILTTCYFVRQGDLDDTFKIAEQLLKDKEDLVHKATGWMLRFAGQKNPGRLAGFLEKHAATMPRVCLRNSIEHMDKKKREFYLQKGNKKPLFTI
jgi:3-methyladenine DNA glycosylase AlkD